MHSAIHISHWTCDVCLCYIYIKWCNYIFQAILMQGMCMLDFWHYLFSVVFIHNWLSYCFRYMKSFNTLWICVCVLWLLLPFSQYVSMLASFSFLFKFLNHTVGLYYFFAFLAMGCVLCLGETTHKKPHWYYYTYYLQIVMVSFYPAVGLPMALTLKLAFPLKSERARSFNSA